MPAPTYAPKNAKDVPCLLPDDALEIWIEDLEIWKSATDLDPKKQVAYVITVGLAQSPERHRAGRQLWRNRKAEYEKEDGLATFLDDLRGDLNVQSFSDKASRLISFLGMKRTGKESLKAFYDRFKSAIDALERDGCPLVKPTSTSQQVHYLLNIKLFSGLRLTNAETQVMRAKVDMETDKFQKFTQVLQDVVFPTSLQDTSGDVTAWADESAHYLEQDEAEDFYDAWADAYYGDDGDWCDDYEAEADEAVEEAAEEATEEAVEEAAEDEAYWNYWGYNSYRPYGYGYGNNKGKRTGYGKRSFGKSKGKSGGKSKGKSGGKGKGKGKSGGSSSYGAATFGKGGKKKGGW